MAQFKVVDGQLKEIEEMQDSIDLSYISTTVSQPILKEADITKTIRIKRSELAKLFTSTEDDIELEVDIVGRDILPWNR